MRQWLIDARKSKGLSQKDMALKVGVSQPTFNNYEHGHISPSVPTAQRIAAALGVEWTKFFEPINRQEEQNLATKRQAM